MKFGIVRTLVAATVAVAALSTWAAAQEWPTGSVRIVNPNAPGGATDQIVRLYAERLSGVLGQPVIVENIEGATGAIGSRTVAESAADGYTFLWSSVTNLAMVPHIREAGYDPLTQLDIVARPVDLLVGLGVPTMLGVDNLQAFIDLVKSQPGALNFASAGVGSTSHLRGVVFNQYSGTDLLHVPYSGGGPALVDLIAGRVQALFDPTVLAQQEGGVTVLAMIGSARHPSYPEIPAITEFYPDYSLPSWQGLYAPAGTDPAIIAKMREAIATVNSTPEMAAALLAVNALPLQDELSRDLDNDMADADTVLGNLVVELNLAE